MAKAVASKVVQQLHIDRANLRKINPISSGHTAFVYLNRRGVYVLGAGRLTMGELWLNTPKEIYAVDISPREESFALELPSQEEAFAFSASVRASWRVSDPIAAVREKVEFPGQAVQNYLEERLREHTRDFDVESSAAAERRINLDLGSRAMPISDSIEVVKCTVVLSLDDATKAHIASRTLALRERETLRQTEETEQQAHLLELQRAAFQRQLEEQKEKHELELKQQRMTVYADALRTDSTNVLALRLAGHGEDVNDVIELMMQQRKQEFEGARAVLNSLLEANLLNRKDVAAIMANASNRMVDHLRGDNPLGIERGEGEAPVPVVAARYDDDEDDE